MGLHIVLEQTNYSDVYYNNGTLIIKKRTGEEIKHFNVPQSVFYGFKTSANTDSYYEKHIENNYPIR